MVTVTVDKTELGIRVKPQMSINNIPESTESCPTCGGVLQKDYGELIAESAILGQVLWDYAPMYRCRCCHLLHCPPETKIVFANAVFTLEDAD